ncbi:unnamed protein product [Malus baccata var. baccata]
MVTLQLSSCGSSFCFLPFNLINSNITSSHSTLRPSKPLISFSRAKIRAISTPQESQSEAVQPQQSPSVDFAFVNSVLLPDQTPDVHLRQACGGQKLRNIMLDSNIDLYGPYSSVELCWRRNLRDMYGGDCSRKRAVNPSHRQRKGTS